MFFIISLNTNTKKTKTNTFHLKVTQHRACHHHMWLKSNQFMLRKYSGHGFSCYSSS